MQFYLFLAAFCENRFCVKTGNWPSKRWKFITSNRLYWVYKKKRILCWCKQTCLSGKMLPNELQLKNGINWDFTKYNNSFLNSNLFWEHFVIREFCIFEIIIKFSIFLTPFMTCFETKKFHLWEGSYFIYLNTKIDFRKNKNTCIL
jgi:hypothetical protein